MGRLAFSDIYLTCLLPRISGAIFHEIFFSFSNALTSPSFKGIKADFTPFFSFCPGTTDRTCEPISEIEFSIAF